MHRLRRHPRLTTVVGLVATVVAAALVVPVVDTRVIGRVARAAAGEPLALALVVVVYALAFLLRAVAWRRLLPALSLAHALAAIHLALGGNHVLPLRLGEGLRVTSAVRRAGIPLRAAAASTVTLRAADVVAVALLALVTGPAVVADLTGGRGWLLLPAGLVVATVGIRWSRRVAPDAVRRPGLGVASAAVVAWLLEAVVVWQVAAWAGVVLSPAQAVLVTSVTVAAQTFAIAPGGFGTYEAAATTTLVALGVDPGTALAVALTAHAVKTVYALLAGAVALAVPAPGLLGRLRLSRRATTMTATPVAPDAPVVLFTPALDEEEAIGMVAARVPEAVHGHRVQFLVIDDGSTDRTAVRARAAGAEVIGSGHQQGLGAAVRRGLAEGVARGACAVVFCDADGEYDPAELDRLVAPILAGDADYVVGSRFSGDIRRMLPHRRFGNRVLTLVLRFVSRVPVTDGQSGYRALSRQAAARAEVIHDFNYAQVLTLDLLAKGFRYAEVPISYRFRETGTSFVRLGRYLRAVVPAVWRELNTQSSTT